MFLFFAILFLLFPIVGTCSDSTQFRFKKLNSGVSGSILSLSNWNGESMESFSFLLSTDYYSVNSAGIRQKIFTGKMELGYTQIIDSLWLKNVDILNFQYFYKKQQKLISQSWNALLNTQLLNSYRYEPGISNNGITRKWNGTFMNPGSVELGYGMGLAFWKKSL